MSRQADLPDDPGLWPTRDRSGGAPRVGSPAVRIARFAREPRLDAVLCSLYRGFGPQRWWPAETPFEVVIGAVLTQNTAWRNAELAIANLREAAALTPARLVGLARERLEELLRPAGTFRVKAEKLVHVSRWYLEIGGLEALRERELEPLRTELLGVWGVGPETADSILCYAAGRRTAVVDAYTRRILRRHELFDGDAPYERIRAHLHEQLVDSQAVYEEFHALCVRTGYDNCKPSAVCGSCPAESLFGSDGEPVRDARGDSR